MERLETLKAQAKNLKNAMANVGVVVSLAQALEAVAQQYGVENWDTLAGMAKKLDAADSAPTGLWRLPGTPYKAELKGCSGTVLKCSVKYIDMAAMAVLHDETKLQHLVQSDPQKYVRGMNTAILTLLAEDSRVFQYSTYDLLDSRPDGEYLYLGGNLAALKFYCHEDRPTARTSALGLVIPQMVKSAKGCQLLVLPSHDGAYYDKHVIVPPHLNAETIAAKVKDEIVRLKQLDRAREDEGDFDSEYTDKDLARFVGSIGCLWVDNPVVVAQNWDC